MKSDEIFEFKLSQVNKIRPKQLEKMDVKKIIRDGEFSRLNKLINDVSKENFQENDYFEFKNNEKKALKTYQVLTQYLIYSINHLKRKEDIVSSLYSKQKEYNESADNVINKQNKKIKELEMVNNNLNSNCASMEYLLKHLNLEDVILNLGASKENYIDNDYHKEENVPNKPIEKLKYEINDDRVDYSSDENN